MQPNAPISPSEAALALCAAARSSAIQELGNCVGSAGNVSVSKLGL